MLTEVRKQIKQRHGQFFVIMFAIILIAYFLNYFIIGFINVHGDSMEPNLKSGSRVLVLKNGYLLSEPQRFDVIVFPSRYCDQCYYIKRIIGLPNEVVYIRDGRIFIDGEVLVESYGLAEIEDARGAGEPIKLAVDEYFVLGDNRNNSTDSCDTDIGNVTKDEIAGKVLIWPKK